MPDRFDVLLERQEQYAEQLQQEAGESPFAALSALRQLRQDLRKFTFEPPSVGAQGLAPLPGVASVRKSCA